VDLDFASSPRAGAEAVSSRLTLKEMEKFHIVQVLKEEGGRVELAARRLDIPRSTLYQKIKALGL